MTPYATTTLLLWLLLLLLLLLPSPSLITLVVATIMDWPGDCINPTMHLTIPFTASAYDVCTAYQDGSHEKFGECGDSTLQLDGQLNNDIICNTRGKQKKARDENNPNLIDESDNDHPFVSPQCHVAFTEPNEWLEYTFMIPNADEYPKNYNPVYNIILRVASKRKRDILIQIDNGGDYIENVVTTSPPSIETVENENDLYFEFHDVIWEYVQFDKYKEGGPERIFVEFLDGYTNFCSITVEETTWARSKHHLIPFDTSAQNYITFIEKTMKDRSGTCGPGPMDSQPNTDKVCNARGSYCNIGWTQPNEQVQYVVLNNHENYQSVTKDVIVRLASIKSKRHLTIEIEGTNQILENIETPGLGYHNYSDFVWNNVTFPYGSNRLIITFQSRGINLCSISVK